MKNSITFLFLIMSLLAFQSCENTDVDTNRKEKITEEKPEPKPMPKYDASTWVGKSQVLLDKIKSGGNYQAILDEYAAVSLEDLAKALDTEDKKFAFWVNTYNGYIQHILSKSPDLYKDRKEFFKKEQINIAGEMISFDKIEHGIIRSSTMKLSLGYLPKLFPGDLEKDLRTEDRDPRIHFVLNCGAKDCPPVYIYDDKSLDADFDKIASRYLSGKTKYDKEKNVVKTSPLFKWFKGDFDGEDGIVEMLQSYGLVPKDLDPDDVDVEYIDYDWTLGLGSFGSQDLITAK